MMVEMTVIMMIMIMIVIMIMIMIMIMIIALTQSIFKISPPDFHISKSR